MISVKKKVAFRTGRGGKSVTNALDSEPEGQPKGRIPRISRLMALAIHFDELLRSGQVQDQSELARLVHVTQPRMTQIMNLLHLAPDIQEELLHLRPVAWGQDSVTERDLRAAVATSDWDHPNPVTHTDQRKGYRQVAVMVVLPRARHLHAQ